ncbi:Esterase/lipase-like protein [Haloferax sulfurifontis ATCC BAA-897]|uniref:Esterase/lipase-like protein n=2 Tax=Haloferax sulfurifontis TaxID=255616 RepID=M0HY54_9EURY|nr:alpha/beta hydrolase fold domain-containing protein [Haloferax sulfurifontis]ELZ88668.1 Esterase/lipase-like protein [Haloferax sulfurifontis ATCC BAA-897]
MNDITVYEGVTYAERPEGAMKLDLYVPEREDPPLVVYVHGGGWVAETRANVPTPERYAAEWDCAIASVSYRLQEVPAGSSLEGMYDPSNPTPRGSFPDHIPDDEVQKNVKDYVGTMDALAPEDIARTITFVVTQPARVDINEVLIRPLDQVQP